MARTRRDVQRWARRGSTTARGYGSPHQKLRARWKPVVDAGQANCHATVCLMPARLIIPGTLWNLGHTPDRTGWTGPEHEKCNKAEGARRGNRMRGQRRAAAKAAGGSRSRITAISHELRTSRDWLEPTCQTCGKPLRRAARSCEICDTHYHPSHAEQRTCGRSCGIELRRRNGTLIRKRWPSCYIRPCERCGTLFTGRTRASRYCSLRCTQTADNHRRRGAPQWRCACGTQLPAGRKKCDDCVRQAKREAKRRRRRRPAAMASENRRRRKRIAEARAAETRPIPGGHHPHAT
jgi:hypothetical protein